APVPANEQGSRRVVKPGRKPLYSDRTPTSKPCSEIARCKSPDACERLAAVRFGSARWTVAPAPCVDRRPPVACRLTGASPCRACESVPPELQQQPLAC